MNSTAWAALAVAFAGTAASAGVLQTFDLYDHPDGDVNPQAYGIRIDDFPNGSGDDPCTFTFENGGSSTVQLQVIDNGGQIDIRIFGTVWGNSATGGTDYGTWDLDVTYSNVNALGGDGGWDTNTQAAIGALTPGDALASSYSVASVNLSSKSNGSESFEFDNDGHRIAGDNSTWVGRGWFMVNDPTGADITDPSSSDFLFIARETPPPLVPLPTGVAMATVGLAGVGLRRRR